MFKTVEEQESFAERMAFFEKSKECNEDLILKACKIGMLMSKEVALFGRILTKNEADDYYSSDETSDDSSPSHSSSYSY